MRNTTCGHDPYGGTEVNARSYFATRRPRARRENRRIYCRPVIAMIMIIIIVVIRRLSPYKNHFYFISVV